MDENKTPDGEVAKREDFWEAWVKANLDKPRKIAEMIAKKEEQASTDSLTGILNRRGVEERFAQMDEVLKRVNGTWTVLYLDLDGLKAINDTLGHAQGDIRIKNTAEALLEARVSDIVGRVGGDEFVVMLTLTDGESSAIPLARIQEKLEEHSIKCSIGVVVNKSGLPPDEVIKKADSLMQDAKNEGVTAGSRSKGIGVITIEV